METKKTNPKKPRLSRSLLKSAELELSFLGVSVISVSTGLLWKIKVSPLLTGAFGTQNTSVNLLLAVIGVLVVICTLLFTAVSVLFVKTNHIHERLHALEQSLAPAPAEPEAVEGEEEAAKKSPEEPLVTSQG